MSNASSGDTASAEAAAVSKLKLPAPGRGAYWLLELIAATPDGIFRGNTGRDPQYTAELVALGWVTRSGGFGSSAELRLVPGAHAFLNPGAAPPEPPPPEPPPPDPPPPGPPGPPGPPPTRRTSASRAGQPAGPSGPRRQGKPTTKHVTLDNLRIGQVLRAIQADGGDCLVYTTEMVIRVLSFPRPVSRATASDVLLQLDVAGYIVRTGHSRCKTMTIGPAGWAWLEAHTDDEPTPEELLAAAYATELHLRGEIDRLTAELEEARQIIAGIKPGKPALAAK